MVGEPEGRAVQSLDDLVRTEVLSPNGHRFGLLPPTTPADSYGDQRTGDESIQRAEWPSPEPCARLTTTPGEAPPRDASPLVGQDVRVRTTPRQPGDRDPKPQSAFRAGRPQVFPYTSC